MFYMDATSGKHLRSFYGSASVSQTAWPSTPSTHDDATTNTGYMDTSSLDYSSGKGKSGEHPMPHSKGPLTNGAAVAGDSIHHRFLVYS